MQKDDFDSRALTPRGRRASTGFTLIEVLVVITITALLITMLLPVMSQAYGVSRQLKCGANEKQIGMGVLEYANDYHDLMNWYYTNGLDSTSGIQYGYYQWGDAVVPYCDPGVRLKPNTDGGYGSAMQIPPNNAISYSPGSDYDVSRLFACPAQTYTNQAYEYTWNPFFGDGSTGWTMPFGNFAKPGAAGSRFSDYSHPDTYCRFLDGNPLLGTQGAASFNCVQAGTMAALGQGAPHPGTFGGNSGPTWRRNGGAAPNYNSAGMAGWRGNCAANAWFQDGHVGYITAYDLINFSWYPSSEPFNLR